MLNKTNNLFKNIYGDETGVRELTLKDFKYDNKKLYITNSFFNNKKGLIIFYAPWCKHCKKISSLIIDLALSNINIFNFGAINTENIDDGNDKLCIYADINRLPTIKIINKDNTLEDYSYSYTIDNLLYIINT
jgi:thiol-disulfide isomerase/thioredoxin